ncbi:MAG: urocanate hydratase, partial [Alphaproteobacteria bacterium]
MTDTRHRDVRIKAERGTTLRCKGWRQETILRMLENNLENGEKPEDLVIYGSRHKAARNWEAFDDIVASLKTLEVGETLIIQSGKAIGIMQTHELAPLVIMANGNVVGNWGTPKDVIELEKKGLTALPGMTAAAWQYIGSQGILQGTYETFMTAAREHYGGDLRGRVVLTAGSGGMGGAQPLAGKMAGAATLVLDVQKDRIQKRIDTGYCDQVVEDLEEALKLIETAKANKQGMSVGLVGNAAEIYPKLLERNWQPDIVTDQVSAEPYLAYFPAGLSVKETIAMREKDPEKIKALALQSIRVHMEAIVEFQRRGAIAFEYGNHLREYAKEAGSATSFEVRGFVEMFIRPLFCRGIGPFRWVAASGDEQDIREVDEIIKENFSANHPVVQWIKMAGEHVHFTGLPARIGWLGHGERSKLGLLVNEAVKSGRLKGPIAFTRDHLDSGSVSAPMRVTEKMPDGS